MARREDEKESGERERGPELPYQRWGKKTKGGIERDGNVQPSKQGDLQCTMTPSQLP